MSFCLTGFARAKEAGDDCYGDHGGGGGTETGAEQCILIYKDRADSGTSTQQMQSSWVVPLSATSAPGLEPWKFGTSRESGLDAPASHGLLFLGPSCARWGNQCILAN